MNRNAVTIVIDYKIYSYLFKPIIAKLVEKKVDVSVFCPSEIKDVLSKDLGCDCINFYSLDDIKYRYINRWRLHRALQVLCTRADFSFQYEKKRGQVTKKFKGMQGMLLRLARFTPKVPNKKINSFLHQVMGLSFSNPFPTRKILVGSLNASAELLCARDQLVYTVMESWDHPVKEPNGYRSHRVYAWNQSLGEDWDATQGDRDWMPFYPLKLRYAYHDIMGNKLWEKARGRRAKLMCVYAVASTRRFSIGVLCDLEERIISDLVIATKEAGWDLFIKPRPNGMDGEFDKFRERNSHVSVGSIVDEHVDVPANYFLDDKYNERRFMEVIEAELVINAFTTFGLDAAAAGIPVLQLDLRDAIGYEDSRLVFNNHHIQKYLLQTPDTFVVKNEIFREKIAGYLKNPDKLADRYRNHLVHWLFSERTMDESLTIMIDDVLGAS